MSIAATMRVAGLYKLPFDPEAFEREIDALGDHAPEIQQELRQQLRQNWDNAWLIVVEWDGPASQVDFSAFSQDPGPNGQVPWLEQILVETADRTSAAFFLHYVRPDEPLFYESRRLSLPSPSPAAPALIKRMRYSPPD